VDIFLQAYPYYDYVSKYQVCQPIPLLYSTPGV
jgi:hypothetical protein